MIEVMEDKLDNRTFVEDLGLSKIWRPKRLDSRVVSVNFSSLWKPYKKISRNTFINYKDLLGQYELYSCEDKVISGQNVKLPVYRKELDGGIEAFLSTDKYGQRWQVIVERFRLS